MSIFGEKRVVCFQNGEEWRSFDTERVSKKKKEGLEMAILDTLQAQNHFAQSLEKNFGTVVDYIVSQLGEASFQDILQNQENWNNDPEGNFNAALTSQQKEILGNDIPKEIHALSKRYANLVHLLFGDILKEKTPEKFQKENTKMSNLDGQRTQDREDLYAFTEHNHDSSSLYSTMADTLKDAANEKGDYSSTRIVYHPIQNKLFQIKSTDGNGIGKNFNRAVSNQQAETEWEKNNQAPDPGIFAHVKSLTEKSVILENGRAANLEFLESLESATGDKGFHGIFQYKYTDGKAGCPIASINDLSEQEIQDILKYVEGFTENIDNDAIQIVIQYGGSLNTLHVQVHIPEVDQEPHNFFELKELRN